MSIAIILAALTLLCFFIYFFYKKSSRSAYLIFILWFLPFMDLGVTAASFGGLSVFDVLTYSTLFLLRKDFGHFDKKYRFYYILFAAFVILLILGSLVSEFPQKSLWSVLSVITPFIYVHLLVKELSVDESFLQKIIKGLKIAGIVAIIFILFQMVGGLQFTFYETLNQNVYEGGKVRYPGFFMDSQMNGIFLAMLSFIYLINFKKLRKPQILQYLLFGIMMTAVLLAGSRSGMLGFTAGFLLLLLFAGSYFRATALLITAMAGVILLYFADSILLIQRFDTVGDSYDFRSSIWKGAYEIFDQNKMLGIGINNYQDYVKIHAQDQSLLLDNNEILYLDNPENGYLKLLSELGGPASTILLLLILAPVIKTFYNFFKGKKLSFHFFFIAPVCAWLVSFVSLYTLSDSRIVIALATFIAILMAFPKDPVTIDET